MLMAPSSAGSVAADEEDPVPSGRDAGAEAAVAAEPFEPLEVLGAVDRLQLGAGLTRDGPPRFVGIRPGPQVLGDVTGRPDGERLVQEVDESGQRLAILLGPAPEGGRVTSVAEAVGECRCRPSRWPPPTRCSPPGIGVDPTPIRRITRRGKVIEDNEAPGRAEVLLPERVADTVNQILRVSSPRAPASGPT